jgi:hypothetical protein
MKLPLCAGSGEGLAHLGSMYAALPCKFVQDNNYKGQKNYYNGSKMAFLFLVLSLYKSIDALSTYQKPCRHEATPSFIQLQPNITHAFHWSDSLIKIF